MTSLTERVLDLAVQIQQIPAPTFQEAERAAHVQSLFAQEGLSNVERDDLQNVYARFPSEGSEPPLVISAHLDTVFPYDTALKNRREGNRLYGPGIGDNSLSVAGLFGLVWALKERNITLPGDLWLVANSGEEGLGNLRGMKEVVRRFSSLPRAYLVLEGMALGMIYHRALGVHRYRVRVRAPGGHSWGDYGKPSAVHELAALIGRLTALPLPEHPRTTMNVGVISGGTTVNTIAAEAWMELDMRSEDVSTLKRLIRRVDRLLEVTDRPPISVSADEIGNRPAGELPEYHPLVKLAQRCLRGQDVESWLGIGSTDANIPLSKGMPAICIGLAYGGRSHTPGEYIEPESLEKGLEQLVCLAQGAFSDLF